MKINIETDDKIGDMNIMALSHQEKSGLNRKYMP